MPNDVLRVFLGKRALNRAAAELLEALRTPRPWG